MMSLKPTYEELEKRVSELERQVEQYEAEGLKNPPDMLPVLMDSFRNIPLCKTFEDAAKEILGQCKRLTGARSGYVALLSENGEENEVLFLDAGGMPCEVDPNLPGTAYQFLLAPNGNFRFEYIGESWGDENVEFSALKIHTGFVPASISLKLANLT